jgi:ornithine carbamoyltransferase
MKKNFLSILDINREELDQLMAEAIDLKKLREQGTPHPLLPGTCLALIFEKASTRTRISFEAGIRELGGHAIFLTTRDMQLGRGEEIRDTARVASGYVSGVMIRAYRHETIEEYARFSTIPVINGLSDREHPCQLLADIMTIVQEFGTTDGIHVAWIGDGNNVCRSLVLSSGMTGMKITVASPEGYEPPLSVVERARELGGLVTVLRDPVEAVRGADVVMTDTWVSMGDEDQKDNRIAAFTGYSITRTLLSKAQSQAIVMHCLPAHRGEEIEDEVIEGPQSRVFIEAENRLHVQKAILVRLLKPRFPS